MHFQNKVQPIIYCENYQIDGRLKSIYQYIDHEKNTRKVSVPDWWIVLAISYFLWILLLLLAALAVVFFSPRAGFHQETCEKRSCLKELNLKCINNTCNCEVGYFYQNKCLPKKNYLEKCRLTSQCKDNTNMTCRDGVCKCVDSKYWNGGFCVDKGTFNSKCTNGNECLEQQLLYCDATKKCLCNSTRFFDGIACYPKQNYGEKCFADSNCQEWRNLRCFLGVCDCDTTRQFWNGYKCISYYTYNNQTCTNSLECAPLTGLICRTDNLTCNCPSKVVNKCDCPDRVSGSEYYWNSTHCVLAASYNESCQATYMCQYLTELTKCGTNNVCECSSNGMWYDNKCVYCDTGFQYTRGNCFRVSSGDLPDHPTIVTGCYNRLTAILAQLINDDVKTLRFSADVYFDGSIVDANFNQSYWCANVAALCTIYDNARCFVKHDCGHAHKYICQYPLI